MVTVRVVAVTIGVVVALGALVAVTMGVVAVAVRVVEV